MKIMYNYLEEIKEDVKNYINDEINLSDFTNREELEEQLNDDLWTVDSVTGNGSGSYTFDWSEAKEYVTDNMEDCKEALNEFAVDAETIVEKFLNEDWEYFDVTIRCWLLGQAISEVLDDIEEELKEAFENVEE